MLDKIVLILIGISLAVDITNQGGIGLIHLVLLAGYFFKIFTYKKIKIAGSQLIYLFVIFIALSVVSKLWFGLNLALIRFVYISIFIVFGLIFSSFFSLNIRYLALPFLLICTVAYFSNYNNSIRFSAFLNNPNKLGYNALLLSTTFLLLSKINVRDNLVDFFLFLWSSIIVVLSLSKSAIIVLGVVTFVYLLRERLYAFFMIAIVVVLILLFEFSDTIYLAERFINASSENDSSLEARGYLILTEFDWYHYIFGMNHDYLASYHGNYELHSSFLFVITEFGLIGLIFFGHFLGKIAQLKNGYLILALILLYGLAHNGLRNTFFWLLMSYYFEHNFKNYTKLID